jgi:23S rRNA pseudouridine2604 synthase
MATIKLKKPDGARAAPRGPREATRDAPRAPVRGAAPKTRPTLAQAQTQRAEREAQYQEQLRQRFGERPPATFQRRSEPQRQEPAQRQRPEPAQRQRRDALPPAVPARGAAFDPRGVRDPRDVRDVRDVRDPRDPRDVRDARDVRARDPRDLRDARGRPPQPTGRNTAFGDRTDRTDRTDRNAVTENTHRPVGPGTFVDPRRAPPPGRSSPPTPASPFQRAAPPAARGRQRHRDDDDDDYEAQPAPHAPGSMRLSKRMSELGIASRREADEWIAKGWVRVDDQVVSELGSRVTPNQRVTVDAKAKFQQAQRVTVLINKPVGYVSGQAEDGYEPAFVLVTPERLWSEDHSGTRFLREHLKSLVPAGRLDIDSVGLLVLTQDGRVAKQLIGEDTEIEKEYLVRVATADGQRLPGNSLVLLRHGLELDGEALKPAIVEWVNDDQLRFVLTQGKKRQIRRMCEAVGLQVLGLKRVRIGKVMLGDLPAGQWRYLRADEVFE